MLRLEAVYLGSVRRRRFHHGAIRDGNLLGSATQIGKSNDKDYGCDPADNLQVETLGRLGLWLLWYGARLNQFWVEMVLCHGLVPFLPEIHALFADGEIALEDGLRNRVQAVIEIPINEAALPVLRLVQNGGLLELAA